MSQTTHQQPTPTGVDPKKKFRIILFGSLGILIPLLLLAVLFFAAKQDAQKNREYDEIRKAQALKFEQQKASAAKVE